MNSQALTLDQVRRSAPSAFAMEANSSRSSRYTYIPTVNVIEGMARAGFQPFRASQSSTRDESRREHTKHMIRFRHENSQAISVGDSLLEVVLVNSHDGSSAYKLMMGIFRLVCSNGLVVADSMQESVNVRHTGNVIRDVIEGSTRIIKNAPKTLEAIREWKSLPLTSGEQQAFAESAHILRFGDAEGKTTTPITPTMLLAPRRRDDSGADLWNTLNRVQENTIRGGLSAWGRDTNNRLRRTTTREVKGIDQDVKLNRALWQLAQRMSELKTPAAA